MHFQHLLAPSSDVLMQMVLCNKASSWGRLIGQNKFCVISCNCTKQFCAISCYRTKRVLCNKASLKNLYLCLASAWCIKDRCFALLWFPCNCRSEEPWVEFGFEFRFGLDLALVWLGLNFGLGWVGLGWVWNWVSCLALGPRLDSGIFWGCEIEL